MKTLSLYSAFLLAGAAAAGCSSQVDGDYPGEPLARVEGTLTTSDVDSPLGGAEVGLVWLVTAGSPDYVTAESVAVRGEFPANFGLDVYTPPAEGALNDYTYGGPSSHEAKIGVAFMIAVTPGNLDRLSMTTEEEESGAPDFVLGGSEDYLLVYADRDVSEGTRSAELLGGPLSEGFHLMGIERCPDEDWECDFDRMHEVDMGTSINIRLVDDPNTIDLPNWT